jgi:hypothetical protein
MLDSTFYVAFDDVPLLVQFRLEQMIGFILEPVAAGRPSP